MAPLTVTDSEFTKNTAVSGGGAVVNCGYEDLIVDGCEFTENSAGYGGAILSDDDAVISNSVFTDNEAEANTNAIFVWYPDTTLALTNNTL